MHLRLAVRRLAATPTFTVAAVAVLALGTGATLAVFTVLNALVLKNLPVHDPDQLVAIEVRNGRGEPSAMARPLFDAVSRRQRSMVQVTGVLWQSEFASSAKPDRNADVDERWLIWSPVRAHPPSRTRDRGVTSARRHRLGRDRTYAARIAAALSRRPAAGRPAGWVERTGRSGPALHQLGAN